MNASLQHIENRLAVCVWPRFVAQARSALPPAVRVAAVVNFPHGNLDRNAVRFDGDAIATGDNEIDLVLPWRAWAGGERRARRCGRACTRAWRGLLNLAGSAKAAHEAGAMASRTGKPRRRWRRTGF